MWRSHKRQSSQLAVWRTLGFVEVRGLQAEEQLLRNNDVGSFTFGCLFLDFETVAYSWQTEPSRCSWGDCEACSCAPGESVSPSLYWHDTWHMTPPILSLWVCEVRRGGHVRLCNFLNNQRAPPTPTSTQTGRPLLRSVILMSRCWARRQKPPGSSFLLIAGRHGALSCWERNEFRISRCTSLTASIFRATSSSLILAPCGVLYEHSFPDI